MTREPPPRVWDASCPRIYSQWEASGATWVVQDLPPEDDDEAIEMLRDHMIPDETVIVTSGLINDPESVEGLLGFWREILRARTTLACYEIRGDSRKFVGLNVCTLLHKDHKFQEDEIVGEKTKNLFRTIMYIESKCDAYEHLGVDVIVEALGLCVRRDYRGHSLGGRILAARESLCKFLGATATATLFTGVASQKLAERCGFTTIAEVTLAELASAGFDFPEGDPRVIKWMVKKYL